MKYRHQFRVPASVERVAEFHSHAALWLVGDSILPGQSTAAVALGGLRVAEMALREMGVRETSARQVAAYQQGDAK